MFRFLADWLKFQARYSAGSSRSPRDAKRLRFEPLESRQMMSVNFGSITNIQIPGSKSVLVPLTGVDSGGAPISYSFSSTPNLQLQLQSAASKSLKLHIQASGTATFSGDLILHLFEDVAPLTTSPIEELVNQGYYDGLDFFRVLDGFMSQGGRKSSGASTQQIDDEFDPTLTYTSRGLLAMANAGDDTNTAEFFITAIDGASTTAPISTADMPQFLNFNYTVFGQLVSGFDLFEQIMSTPTQDQSLGSQTEHSDPIATITITSAQIITDTQNAVLKVTPLAGFTGTPTITVTATGGGGATQQQNFTAAAIADPSTTDDPPFLTTHVADQTVEVGHTLQFTLAALDPGNLGIYFDGGLEGGPAGAHIEVDHVTGQVTITQTTPFVGTATFGVGVRGGTAGNSLSDFDTETFTVTWPPDLSPVTNQITVTGAPKTLTLSESHGVTSGVSFSVVDPTTLGVPAHVSVSINPTTGLVTLTPDAGFTGQINLRAIISATDASGQDSADFTLTVQAPTLDPVPDQTTATGVPATTFTLKGTNPAGGGLLYSIVDAATLLPPADLQVAINQSTGAVTLTPANGFTGAINLLARVRAADSQDLPENYTTDAFTLNVVAPTLDAVPNQTTATGVTLPTFTLHATSPAGGGVTYSIIDADTGLPATNVAASIDQSTGEVTLTPAAGFSGTINLLARVRAEGSEDTPANYTTQAFSLNVLSPTLAEVSDKTTARGVGVPPFTLNATNPAGGTLVYSIVDASTLLPPVSVLVQINQSTGAVTLTPANGFAGTLNLLARVRATGSADVAINYVTQTFKVDVLAPTLDSVADIITAKGVSIAPFTLVATNPAGGGLQYNIVDADTGVAPVGVTASVDGTGQVTLTPDLGFAGTLHLLARVRAAGSPDFANNYTTQSFTVTVAAILLDDVANKTTAAGAPAQLTLNATNPVGGALVYSVVDAVTLLPPANITVSVDQATGHVTLTPTAGFTGTVSLTARVRATGSDDVPENYTTKNFTLSVFSLDAVADQTTGTGAPVSFTPSTTPATGGVVFKVVDPNTFGTPGNVTVTIDPQTGQVTLKPAAGFSGPISLLVAARGADSEDIEANYVTQAFTLNVFAPTLAEIANKTTAKGVPVPEFNLTATNPAGGGVVYNIIDVDTGVTPTDVLAQITPAGAMTLTPTNGFAGTIHLRARVRAAGSDDVAANYTTQDFSLEVLAPTINAVGDQVTSLGVPVPNFMLSGTNPAGGGLVFDIVDANTLAAPVGVEVDIDQATGAVTLTPANGFTGPLNLLARARATGSATSDLNFATDAFTLTVSNLTLADVTDKTTAMGAPVASFTLSGTNPNGGVIYSIIDADTGLAPTNVLPNITQATGTVTLTPVNGFSGAIHLLARVRATGSVDDSANYVTDAFTLTVVAPALENISNKVTVLGVPLSFDVTASNSTGSGLVYQIFDANTGIAPTNITATISGTGQVSLTPDDGFTGTRQLRVRVRAADAADVESNFVVKDFTFTVSAPTLVDVTDKATLIGVPLNFTLNATNPAGGGLVYSVVDANTLALPTDVTVNVDQATGKVTLTPHAGFSGVVNLLARVRATDSADVPENYTTDAFQLTVSFTLDEISNKTTGVGAPVTFDLTTTPSTGGLIFKIVDSATFAAPAHVIVTVDPATGHVTLTPESGFVGTIHLLAAVRGADTEDVEENYTTQAFDLTTVAPTLPEVADKTTAKGVPVSFNFNATNPAGGGLVYSIIADTVSTLTNVQVDINQATGAVTLTPINGVPGTIHLLARVRAAGSDDIAANYTTQAFDLEVLAPTIDAVSDKVTSLGVPVPSFMLSGTNPTGGGLIFDIVDATTLAAPVGVTVSIDQATGAVTLTPANGFTGTLNLLARARAEGSSNDASNFATDTFSLVVSNLTLQDVTDKTTTIGAPLASFTLSGTNPNGGVIYSIIDADTGLTPTNVLATINQATGAVTLTPSNGFSGAIHLLARVRAAGSVDAPANYVTNAFTLTVVAPTIEDVLDKATVLGVPLSFGVTASNSTGSGLVYQIIDADTGIAPTGMAATISGTGQVNLDPDNGFTGTRHLRVRVRAADAADVESNYVFNDFTFTVSAPTLADIANKTTAKGTPLSFATQATNPAGGGLIYQIFDADSGVAPTNVTATISETGQVTLTPANGFAGSRNLRVRVRAAGSEDVAANYVSEDFMLTVSAPTLGAVTNKTTVKGLAIPSFALSSTIPGGAVPIYSIVDPNTLAAPANVTINIDQATGQVTLTPAANFTGTINLLARVRATGSADSADNYATQDFTLTVVGLNTVANQTTDKNVAKQFTLSTTPGDADVIFSIVDPTTLGTPANVTVGINQDTGAVTLTPATDFTGTINLLARVRLTGSDDVAANYTTQAFTLTVGQVIPAAATDLAIDPSSYTGPFDGNGYVSKDTVKLTVKAATGSTVQFKINGVVVGTGTETAAGSGVYTVTLAAGKLAIGVNSVVATASNTAGPSPDSSPLAITYGPNYDTGLYVVPGAPGSTQSVTFDWKVSNAGYRNEVGYFIADSADGSINGIAPGAAGYAQSALSDSSAHVIFGKGAQAGASQTLTLLGGQIVVFYIIQNNTTANFLANNPSNTLSENNQSDSPMAFFSIAAANPDGSTHTQTIADPTTGRVQYNWEDLVSLGDSDFNDVVINIRLASQSSNSPAVLRTPGTGSTTVNLGGLLNAGQTSGPVGDLGVYFVDDPNGTIDGLSPGASGYWAKALASGNFQVLFAGGSNGSKEITVPAGKYVAFFSLTSGTAAQFLSANPSNSPTGGLPVAFSSFDAANPSGTTHFRWYSPGTQPTSPGVMQLHVMDKVSGGESDFDSFTIDLDFSS